MTGMATTAADQGSRPSRRRTGGRSARVRAAVLEATYTLALERGLTGFSVADVADRAGVHQTSVYRRWTDRERLLVDAVRSRIDEAAPIPDTGSLEGDLCAFLEATAAFMRTPEGLLLSRLAVTAGESPALLAPRTEYWNQVLTSAAKMFERASARGEITTNIAAAAAVEIIVGPLWFRALVSGADLDAAFVKAITHTALTGLRPPA